MKSCPYCGNQYSANTVVCPIDRHPLVVATEPRGKIRSVTGPTPACPNCGTTNDFTQVVEPRSFFSWPAFIFGGIFAVIFRNAGHARKARCNHCEAPFYIRHRLAIFAWILFWLLVAPRILILINTLYVILGYFFLP